MILLHTTIITLLLMKQKFVFKTLPKWVDNFEEVGIELMLLTSEQAEHAFREFYNFLNSDKL